MGGRIHLVDISPFRIREKNLLYFQLALLHFKTSVSMHNSIACMTFNEIYCSWFLALSCGRKSLPIFPHNTVVIFISLESVNLFWYI